INITIEDGDPGNAPIIFSVFPSDNCSLVLPEATGGVFVSASGGSNSNGAPVEIRLVGADAGASYDEVSEFGDFSNVPPGAYLPIVTDTELGCVTIGDTIFIGIREPDQGFLEFFVNENCATETVDIEAFSSSPNVGFSIDGINYNAAGLFPNLSPGNYTLYSIDSAFCSVDTVEVEIVPFGISVEVLTMPTCSLSFDGVIQLSSNSRFSTYEIFVDGFLYDSGEGPVFSNLPAGQELAITQAFSSCQDTTFITLDGVLEDLTVNAVILGDPCTASGPASVRVDVDPIPSEPLEYSLDFINFQPSNVFTNLAPGTYTFVAQYAETSCSYSQFDVVIEESSPLSFTVEAFAFLCEDVPGGVQFQNIIGGTEPYQYTVDGQSDFGDDPF
ncbi:MAG: hypothetical protein AAF597_19080, partial [Bacteroidota bacterium]